MLLVPIAGIFLHKYKLKLSHIQEQIKAKLYTPTQVQIKVKTCTPTQVQIKVKP